MWTLFDYHTGGTERYNVLTLIVPRQEKASGNGGGMLFSGGTDCGQSLTRRGKA